MPRRRQPPRLYPDQKRRQWVIRDGAHFERTGCTLEQIQDAEQKLQGYLARKYSPRSSGSPLIADILMVYLDEHIVHTRSRKSNESAIKGIAAWWGDKRVSDITPDNCRAYVAHKGRSRFAARHDLEALRAAVNYWHKSNYGPLDRVPAVLLPPKADGRDRWLTDKEFELMLKAARGNDRLTRFLLLGWYTGTRPGALFELQWDWIDLRAGVMRRRAIGQAEHDKKRRPPVRLGQTILAHLRRWKAKDGDLCKHIVHFDGKPLKTIRNSWENAVAAAGLDERVTPHCLRHSRATRLMQRGKDRWQVAGHLGMTVETLERVYGHHHPDFQRGVADD